MKINIPTRLTSMMGAALVLCTIISTPVLAIVGDLNGDGRITSSDVDVLVSHFRSSNAASDLDNSGTVDPYDLSTILTLASQTGSSAADKLKWAPPTLANPTTINIPTGDAAYTATLNNSTDYILKLPPVARGPVSIWGGRNVVMIGGHLHMTASSLSAGRILYINGNGGTGGTTHIEGVLMDRDEGLEADDIAISAPNRTVQLENIRGMGVRGSFDGVHGDVVQPWGGVSNLFVDHMTASSNYQGFFLRPDLGHIGTIELNNINLYYDSYPPAGGGYLIWLTTDGGGTYGEIADSVNFSEVYLNSVRAASTFAHSIWPQVGAAKGAVISGNQATWPAFFPDVTGQVTQASPPGGDFVPDGVAGTSYVSPGYK